MNSEWAGLIKQVRTKFGLSQKALSDLTGVSQKSISRWERGDTEPGGQVQAQLIGLLQQPTPDLLGSLLESVRHCPAPRALSRWPNLKLLAVSQPAIAKRPSVRTWIGRDLAPIACGVLQDMLNDRDLQKSIQRREIACIVTTTDSVLRTEEHLSVGKFATTITYFAHDGEIYSDAVSVPAPASAIRGYRPVMIDNLLAT